MRLHSNVARVLGGTLALIVGATLCAPQAIAAGPAPKPIAAAAAAKVEAMPAATLAQAAQTKAAPAGTTVDKPFFKTGKGVAALALLAGGLGYMTYSLNHDRVKSPGR